MIFQPQLTEVVLDRFCVSVLESDFNDRPIFIVMKKQIAFNGYGAQKSTDALCPSLVHPRMPITLVFKNDSIWKQFCQTILEWQSVLIGLLEGKNMEYRTIATQPASKKCTRADTLCSQAADTKRAKQHSSDSTVFLFFSGNIDTDNCSIYISF